MNLWLLEWVDKSNERYDRATAFVVRADTEARARALADEATPGGEGYAGDYTSGIDALPTKHPWLDSSLTTCIPLAADGPEEVICVDFYEP